MTLNDRVKKITVVLDLIEQELTKRIEVMQTEDQTSNVAYIKKSQRSTNSRKNAKYRNND